MRVMRGLGVLRLVYFSTEQTLFGTKHHSSIRHVMTTAYRKDKIFWFGKIVLHVRAVGFGGVWGKNFRAPYPCGSDSHDM